MNANYQHVMCRLCLCKSGSLSDIHGCKVGSGLIAAAVISDLLQLHVSVTDGYPQLVCLVCLKKLYDFQRFKDLCWKAKAKFDTLYNNIVFSDVYVAGGWCGGEINNVVNHGDSLEPGEGYSKPCNEKDMNDKNFEYKSELYIKEEDIEKSDMKDPLSLESPYSDGGEILEEDITIEEEEIKISIAPKIEETSVTFIEKTGNITMTQVKSDVEDTGDSLCVSQPNTSSTKDPFEDISSTKDTKYDSIQVKSDVEDTRDSLCVLQPNTSSTKGPFEDISSTKDTKYDSIQVKPEMEREDTKDPLCTKQLDPLSMKDSFKEFSLTKGANNASHQVISKFEENKLVKDTNGHSASNNTSDRMLLVPLNFLLKLNVHAQNQSRNSVGKVAQNGGNVVNAMEMRTEGNSSTVERMEVGNNGKNSMVVKMKVGEEGKNSTVDELDIGDNDKDSVLDGMKMRKGKILIRDEMVLREKEGKVHSVQYFCKNCCKMFGSIITLADHSCGTLIVKNFECKICGKKFETEKILWNHTQKHKSNMNYFCQICGRGFQKEEDLSMHLPSHKISFPLQPIKASGTVFSIPSSGYGSDTGQSQEKVVPSDNVATDSEKKKLDSRLWKSKTGNVCPVCGGVYSTLSTLKRHILHQHSERNFECNLCHKKFRTEIGLEHHSRKHRENRPFKCEVCGAGFFTQNSLSKHVLNHAVGDPFQCDRCGKKCYLKRQMWLHVALCYKTKWYECDICNKKVACKKYLSIHKTIHSGEKNEMCEVCGKTFRGLKTLSIHKRQHTGEKPYSCDICDKRFTQRISLVKHKKKYH